MDPHAANNLSDGARFQLRQAGLRMLAWPLLCIGGIIWDPHRSRWVANPRADSCSQSTSQGKLKMLPPALIKGE